MCAELTGVTAPFHARDALELLESTSIWRLESVRYVAQPFQAAGWRSFLVCCSQIQWEFAAMDFWVRRGVSDEHTLQRSVRSEQRSLNQKDMPPTGLRRIWLLALLLLGHRSLRICSLVAPRQKPNAAQQMPTQFVNSTLAPRRGPACGGAWCCFQDAPRVVAERRLDLTLHCHKMRK